jgi:DNA-directed RNA polymerase subunit RPC12/RpoP
VGYSPGTRDLLCPYCGFRQEIAANDATIEEHSYDDWSATAPKARTQLGALTLRCHTCAAQTTSDDLSISCPFCGAPVVVEVDPDDQLAPEAVVPFGIDQRAAQDAVQGWVRSRWFAPNRLRKVGSSETMKGTYLPHWTFDARTGSDYLGQRGEHYWVSETYTDSQGRTQTRQVMRTRWWPAAGHVARSFDDVLVPATTKVAATRLQALGPWSLPEAAAYQPDYLAGFRTLRYDVEPEQGLQEAKGEMATVIQQDCRADIGGDEQRVHRVDTTYADIMFKLVLLPVWIAAYLYGGSTYQVFVNARTGEVTGERPYSIPKIIAAVLAALVAIAVIAFVVARTRRPQ